MSILPKQNRLGITLYTWNRCFEWRLASLMSECTRLWADLNYLAGGVFKVIRWWALAMGSFTICKPVPLRLFWSLRLFESPVSWLNLMCPGNIGLLQFINSIVDFQEEFWNWFLQNCLNFELILQNCWNFETNLEKICWNPTCAHLPTKA